MEKQLIKLGNVPLNSSVFLPYSEKYAIVESHNLSSTSIRYIEKSGNRSADISKETMVSIIEKDDINNVQFNKAIIKKVNFNALLIELFIEKGSLSDQEILDFSILHRPNTKYIIYDIIYNLKQVLKKQTKNVIKENDKYKIVS